MSREGKEKKRKRERAILRPFFSLHFSFPFLSCLFATHMTIPSVHFLSLFLPQVLQQQPCNAFRARLCACGERGKGTRREECTRETCYESTHQSTGRSLGLIIGVSLHLSCLISHSSQPLAIDQRDLFRRRSIANDNMKKEMSQENNSGRRMNPPRDREHPISFLAITFTTQQINS